MRLTKKKEKSSIIHWLPIIISVAACIVSFITLMWNIVQNNRIYEHSYKIDALTHKPRLEPSKGIFFDTINERHGTWGQTWKLETIKQCICIV
jgi:hypothetical protein